ncbi:MAG: MBL fold metallo-hydrolase [Candidatus Thorarchaeota archaeon]
MKRAKMEIHKLGERNLTVAFQDPFYTTTHLIFGDHRVYVCDTFLGPDSMKDIAKIIKENGHQDKPIVVFNSHADWDHVWGNCFFGDSMIISHRECRNRMIIEWKEELEKNREHQRGNVILARPTHVFDENYIFEDDGVEFFHSPGHTVDSSSCYDQREKILFVGDNVESDVPYVNLSDFDIYISTLESYLSRDWTHLVLGHDHVQTDDVLIRSNIEYLQQLSEWKVDLNSLTQKGLEVHLYTLSKLVKQIYVESVQKKAKPHYLEAISILEKMEPNDKIANYLNLYRKFAE